MISWADFENVDIRVGRIVEVDDFPKARKRAYQLKIDFGDALGIKKSSAQITDHYTKSELIGKQILAVCNFPPKQIGPIMSEVLVLGVSDDSGKIVLLVPELNAPLGAKVH